VDPFAVRHVTVIRTGFRLTFTHDPDERRSGIAHAATLVDAGLTSVRVRVPWHLLFPRRDVADRQHREALVEDVTRLRELGAEVWITLCGRQLPGWFLDDGGFSDAKLTERSWPRYVDTIASDIGDIVTGWIPFESPIATALVWRGAEGEEPPARFADAVAGLVMSWVRARRLLHGTPLVLSLDLQHPGATTQLRQIWIEALQRGTLSIPGRLSREIDGLQHSADIVGLSANAPTAFADGSALARWAEHTVAQLFLLTDSCAPAPLTIVSLPEPATDAQHEDLIASLRDVTHEAVDGGATLGTVFLGEASRVAGLAEPPSGF
jgi:hypothetical protein